MQGLETDSLTDWKKLTSKHLFKGVTIRATSKAGVLPLLATKKKPFTLDEAKTKRSKHAAI